MSNINRINESISYLNHKIENREYTIDDFLGFYHENDLDTINLLYLEPKGCEMYGKTLLEIQEAGPSFLQECLHTSDLERCVSLLLEFAAEKNEDKVLSYVQRLKMNGETEHKSFFTCAKVNLSRNIFQCITTPITEVDPFKEEINRILEASKYINNYIDTYTSFSTREREVITLVCQGINVKDIAEQLFLSPHTIEQHKKNIFKKSGFQSNAELIEFAINFNLT